MSDKEVFTEKIVEVQIKDEMKKAYLEYAMSVIIGRALPDVRDGLKPVHRRVLFAMSELKNNWNKAYKKSARVVGDVIGKYHPHGDAAVYHSIVRMAQSFSMRYPLVDGQGNFGSIDGDSPAAMRYTEVRMQKITEELLLDLEKDTVDFVENYDESLLEPNLLPSKIPNLLVNGSSGIAVGMTTNIPPHNLSEVIDATIAMIDNPNISIDELIEYIPGPDFPTYGEIYGRKGIIDAYKTGRGIVKMRAKIEVEEDKLNNKTIIITQIPYQVNKAKLIEKVAELVKDKVIENIKFVRDESDRRGMRIAIGLKKGQNEQIIINQLFKHTQAASSFGVTMLAIVDKKPELLNLKEVLTFFILHRKEIIRRRTAFDLKNAIAKAHILEGLKKAIENLDEVIKIIRQSASPQIAKEELIRLFDFSDKQAAAILDMRLQRLTGLEREKIIEDYEETLKNIRRCEEILGSETIVLDIIKEELCSIKEEFGDERRTVIVEEEQYLDIEDLIEEENMVITITQTGYIKRQAVSVYHSQKRGGKGKIAMSMKDEDLIEHLFIASTHHYFLFFTNFGKVYWSKVYNIPEGSRTSKGKAVVNLFDFAEGEKLSAVLNVADFEEDKSIIMATKKGIIKKSNLMEYSRPRVKGIIAIKLQEDDELISVKIASSDCDIFLGTLKGKTIRFSVDDLREVSRNSIGVRGIRLKEDDALVNLEVSGHGNALFTANQRGYGKRSKLEDYRVQKRGGSGVITIKANKKNGFVVNSLLVGDDDELMIMTNLGKLIRIKVKDISTISRNTKGVRIISMGKDEEVAAIVRMPKDTEDIED